MDKVHVPTVALPRISDFGFLYEIVVETDCDITPEKALQLSNRLIDELEAHTAHVESIQFDARKVTIQLKGSPFIWTDILGLIGALFPFLAIGIVLIAVYFLLTTVPGWVWGLLFLAATAFIVAPIFLPTFTKGTKAVQKGLKQITPAKPKKKELPPSQAEIERVKKYLAGER